MSRRMQKIIEFEQTSSPGSVGCLSLWNSIGSGAQSSLSKSFNLNLDSPMQHCDRRKLLGLQLQDQESSSTQSTGQSHMEVANIGTLNSQPGCDETLGKFSNGQTTQVVTSRKLDFVFPAAKVNCAQPFTCIQYTHADPYTGGIQGAIGPQAFIHPQLLGIPSTRVPLPLDLTEDEPFYVNAKQYHGILRRRESRAKMEAQNKLIKARKPYLHESRHIHAMKRARGAGGRFLNTKKLQQSERNSTMGNDASGGSALLQLGGKVSVSEALQPENSGIGIFTTCSEVNISNGDSLTHKANLGFSSFRSHIL